MSEVHVKFSGLSENEIEDLVERVTQRVMANFYQEVGKSVVKKFLQVVGFATVAIGIWIAGGKLKLWGV